MLRVSFFPILSTSIIASCFLFVTPILSAEEEAMVQANIENILAKILTIESTVNSMTAGIAQLEGKATGMEVKETETEVHIELSGDVLFDFDKWDIRPVAVPTLEGVAKLIAQHPTAKIVIEGYTDAKGADAYNLKLSEQRALSVKNWLAHHHSSAKQTITTKGWGEAKPVAVNSNPDGSDNPEGRQKNRRVEITVKKG